MEVRFKVYHFPTPILKIPLIYLSERLFLVEPDEVLRRPPTRHIIHVQSLLGEFLRIQYREHFLVAGGVWSLFAQK